MGSQNCGTRQRPWPLYLLLMSGFCASCATHIVTPLLPIYLVETAAYGGLAWSKAEAFSVFGTFLAVLYISPFIGGMLSDCILGRPLASFVGYCLTFAGVYSLSAPLSRSSMVWALSMLATGFGFVKVNLVASFGALSAGLRERGYNLYYIFSSLGFAAGGPLSSLVFGKHKMRGIALASASLLTVSFTLFFVLYYLKVFSFNEQKPSANARESHPAQYESAPFFALLLLSIPFFVCSSQLTSSLAVFMHQRANRTIGAVTIPALCFYATGSLSMMVCSPWLRKNRLFTPCLKQEPRNFAVAFGCMAFSFATVSFLAQLDLFAIPAVFTLPVLTIVHFMCCVADFYVRPTLYSSAAHSGSKRYPTVCTALVYACIGLGGKGAGMLASLVETIGFCGVFASCAAVAAICGWCSFVWDRKPALGGCEG